MSMSLLDKMSFGDLYVEGTITTVDGTLVQESIDFSRLMIDLKKGIYMIPRLKKLEMEIVPQNDILDTQADQFTVTITPDSKATHPFISDRECLFKHLEYTTDNPAATDPKECVMNLVKNWRLDKNAVLVTNKAYIQVTLDATATTIHYRLYYEWIKQKAENIVQQILNQTLLTN